MIQAVKFMKKPFTIYNPLNLVNHSKRRYDNKDEEKTAVIQFELTDPMLHIKISINNHPRTQLKQIEQILCSIANLVNSFVKQKIEVKGYTDNKIDVTEPPTSN